MSMPFEHIKERLSVAYVRAVTARAGAKFTENDAPEYGVDGFIRAVKKLPSGKYTATGFLFHCQLKATSTCELVGDCVVYDMKVNAYNKLAQWEGNSPCILVLFRLPENPTEWLRLDEDQLLLRNCCYWEHVTGPPSANTGSQRVKIPRSQTFTPDAVRELLEKVKQGVI